MPSVTTLASPLRLLWLLLFFSAVVAAVSGSVNAGDSKPGSDPGSDPGSQPGPDSGSDSDPDDQGGPTTSAETDVPNWAANQALQLTLTPSFGPPSPLQYTVIPLTRYLGLNGTDESRGIVSINGNMIAVGASNYNDIDNKRDIAYLSCDESDDQTFVDPTKMLQKLMSSKPRAIVLYSTSGNWCSLDDGGDDEDLIFTSILSMADAAEASNALGYLNGTDAGKIVKVSISGNRTSDESNGPSSHGSKATPAMSALYSVTAIISVLFLSVIITGAVRAHRYPERYGPRGALGGRPRQSRAKGLARAVLDTIPIVKFGNPAPTKPDPDLELDTATVDGQDVATQRTASNLSDETRPGPAPASSTELERTASPAAGGAAVDGATKSAEGRLGCSICTEDFKVGEDVRVLPCSHQFHPSCIDPWLINVSGTCPLCRLDLRPDQGSSKGSDADGDEALPPPLILEGDDTDAATTSHRNRFSRIFDINRLRQATVEEQMEALRQMRAEEGEHGAQEAAEGAEAEGEERRQGAGFTDKLRERFRIRTRAQSPHRREG